MRNKVQSEDSKRRLAMSREKSRLEESRGMETRRAALNPQMQMGYLDPLYVNPANIPDGMTYHWMCVSVYNEPHQMREIQFSQQGWTPVPASRHPERNSKFTLNPTSHLSQYIMSGGLLLCEIPTEIHRQMQEFYNRETYMLQNNLHGLDNNLNDSRIPTNFQVFDSMEPEKGIRNEIRSGINYGNQMGRGGRNYTF